MLTHFVCTLVMLTECGDITAAVRVNGNTVY